MLQACPRGAWQWLPAAASRWLATRAAAAPTEQGLGLKDVKHVIAVASGKGGVGKSTTAANLAVAFATRLGLKVGLMDADIHGPSIPLLMNLRGRPAVEQESMLMLPLENYHVKCMSFGFFMEGDAPVIWRGPIVNSTINKFLYGTAWGPLDVLVVDMPPGTGDAQITLSQRLPLSGAVMVTTPQDVALIDARRGTRMFQKVNVPILGLVENMSWHVCQNCGHREEVFGGGGGAAAAAELDVELIGQVPLEISVRQRSDAGTPIVLSDPAHPCAEVYASVARVVWQKLAGIQRGSQQPEIVMQ